VEHRELARRAAVDCAAVQQAAAEGSVTKKERYDFRKANRLCADCEAGLQDEDGVCCVECSARRVDWQKRNPDARRAIHARWRQKNSAKRNAYQRERYEQNKVAGICVQCMQPSLEDSIFCEPHRDASRKVSRETQRRRRAAQRAA
jgi:hypothetical protein